MIEIHGMGWRFTCDHCMFEFVNGEDMKKWNWCPDCGYPINDNTSDNPYKMEAISTVKYRNDILNEIDIYRSMLDQERNTYEETLEQQFNISSILHNLSLTYKNLID